MRVLGGGLRRKQDRAVYSPDSTRRLRAARLDAGFFPQRRRPHLLQRKYRRAFADRAYHPRQARRVAREIFELSGHDRRAQRRKEFEREKPEAEQTARGCRSRL